MNKLTSKELDRMFLDGLNSKSCQLPVDYIAKKIRRLSLFDKVMTEMANEEIVKIEFRIRKWLSIGLGLCPPGHEAWPNNDIWKCTADRLRYDNPCKECLSNYILDGLLSSRGIKTQSIIDSFPSNDDIDKMKLKVLSLKKTLVDWCSYKIGFTEVEQAFNDFIKPL